MIDLVWEVREREVRRMTPGCLAGREWRCMVEYYILKDNQFCWDDNGVFWGSVELGMPLRQAKADVKSSQQLNVQVCSLRHQVWAVHR